MTEPDRLNALSERITALTGRNLTRDELVTVAGRAFEHQIDLDDDGQLRALLGGLTSGGLAGGQVGGPPVSYGQPTAPSYPVPQPGYPQAYSQPGWPAMNPMMAPGYPMMPPMRAPKAPTRHPAGFIVGGILIVLAALATFGLTRGWKPYYEYYYDTFFDYYGYIDLPGLLLHNAGWLILAVAFTLVAVNARGATRVPAAVAAAASLLTPLVNVAAGWFMHLGSAPGMMLLTGLGLIFAGALLATGITGRRSFGVFGLVTAVGYGVLEVLADVVGFAGLFGTLLVLSLVQLLFLLLFGIAVSCGKVPATSSPGPMHPSNPDPGPSSGPVPPAVPDGTSGADTP